MANRMVKVPHKSQLRYFPHAARISGWVGLSHLRPTLYNSFPPLAPVSLLSVGATMKHHCLPCLFLLVALSSAQVSFGNSQEQRPRPRPPLSRPPPRARPPLPGRPPRPVQPGNGRPPRPVGFPNRPRPQGPFQGQQGQRPFQGQEGQRPNLGQPGSGERPGNQIPIPGQH